MSQNKIRVHLAEADYLARLGLERLLSTIDYVELGMISTTGTETIEAVKIHTPDILLMEASINNVSGLEAAGAIAESWPGTRIVMLSSSYDLEGAVKAHQAGARAYLAKNAITEDLGPALRMIHRGEVIFSLPRGMRGFPPPAQFRESVEQKKLQKLGKEAQQTLFCVAKGMPNSHIAGVMLCSEATVKARVSQIMATLQLHNRVQIAVLAARAGLLERDDLQLDVPNRAVMNIT